MRDQQSVIFSLDGDQIKIVPVKEASEIPLDQFKMAIAEANEGKIP